MSKKHSNGCLLSFLKMFVVWSFVLMMGLFLLSREPKQVHEENQNIIQKVDSKKQYINIKNPNKKEILSSDKDIYINEIDEKEIVSSNEEIDINEIGEKEKISGNEAVDINVMGEKEVVLDNKEVNTNLIDESINTDKVFNEYDDTGNYIPIYNRGQFKLSEDVWAEAEQMMSDGTIDIMSFISKYFNQITYKDKIQLTAIIMSKIKDIDVIELWKLVSDGITTEEIDIMGQMIQEHFTEEEINELYEYCLKSDFIKIE
ncbi:MAG: hypothetical protein ACRCSG_05445 [Cellulosilyticaceae bacterium]